MDIHQEMNMREIKRDVARIRWWVVFWGRLAAIILGRWVILFILYIISGAWIFDLWDQSFSY